MRSSSKIKPLADVARILEKERRLGRKIVHCHGVFDLLHPGHVLHLEAARRHGDLLVVTVTPDRFVRKGPGRPVFPERLRAQTIAAFACVDHVALNEWPTAERTIRLLRPHVYVKGSDYADASKDLTGKIRDEAAAVRAVGGKIAFTHEESFSSSALVNRHMRTLPEAAERPLEEIRRRWSGDRVVDLIRGLGDLRVLVVGEAILDEYRYAVPLGKSPKETIIATKYQSEERFAGGSVAVANHLAGLCRHVTLLTCLGPEADRNRFLASRLRPNVRLDAVRTPGRPTIAKVRYVEPTFLTKMFEVQVLDDSPVPPALESRIRDRIDRLARRADLVVVTDFGHGMLTDRLCRHLSSLRVFLAVNTQTNSANLGFNPMTRYPRVDFACLHEGELKFALRDRVSPLLDLARHLRAAVRARDLVVTRGPNGSLHLSRGGAVTTSPALSLRVVDRTGAGDTFFAAAAPCAFRRYPPEIVGLVGNVAGALAVETVGNREPLDPVDLQKYIRHLLA